ncbi:S41 family peptidase [Temperatibacter marinus]|uniref:Tricorn protease homolog n=1 Tax=Temperatibacter marinus TaxID=1456591 RepID=A0AA52EGF9_9PROT|nr:S41 family peptidase [Temperatibacter marinus]WND01616.1 S41 family peptidase [Temperatibacter marinus]
MNKSRWILSTVMTMGMTLPLAAQSNVSGDWYQHAAISPDGKEIVFSYKGNLFKVAAKGGAATPLTMHSAWEGHPVWSDDGKSIAFASDRHGNLDIFVMPASGGKAKRLTHHSSNDRPTDFNNGMILFNSTRTDAVESSLFPRGSLNELYKVSTKGGTPSQLLTTATSEAQWNSDGTKILYRDEKALESDLRKHDISAFARDIWLYNSEDGSHTQLTTFEGADHSPVWSGSNKAYYLSEDGHNNFNVWSMNLSNGNKSKITDFETHPVRGLSISSKGTMAFTQHGDIYTLRGKSPKKVKITIAVDGQNNDYVTLPVSRNVSEFSVSGNGKEVAFVARGEVYVTSTDFATTVRVTNTPEQERSVSFAPDGKTLVYASERGGKWKIIEASLKDESEKYFYASTGFTEKVLADKDNESFQPTYSPDGKKVAFLANRDAINVVDRESGKIVTALDGKWNYSYADGDISYSWASDSKWLTASFATKGRLFYSKIGVFPADGSAEPVDLSQSGYSSFYPKWNKDGQSIIYGSLKYGRRNHGSWGADSDVFATFLTQDAYDEFTMSKEDYELMKELEKERKKKEEKAKKKAKEEKKKAAEKAKADKADSDQTDSGKDVSEDVKKETVPKSVDKKEDKKKDKAKEKPLTVDLTNLPDRTVRLTVHSSNMTDYAMTKKADKLLYLTRFEGGFNLWEQKLRERGTKLILPLNARTVSMELSKDDKSIFLLADGRLMKAPISGGRPKPIALAPVMELKADQERAYMFEHVWRQVQDKFYNPNMHGIDWAQMKADYKVKLPALANNRDFARMMEEMLGELNASHTGMYYRARMPGSDATASLGILFDMTDTAGALTVDEILSGSPLDKAKSKVKTGMKLTAVDGKLLSSTTNFNALMNNKAGQRTRLTFVDSEGNTLDEVIRPIAKRAEDELMYHRWVKNRRNLVKKLSGGRLTYVHVRSMNDASFREVYSDLMGNGFDKEAAIVDTRWNGGGWLHNDLAKLLAGKDYSTMHVRGRQYNGDPGDQYTKPSIVVMGEGNYSDAYGFPFAYTALNIGETVGMPVPGTMTAVWWELLVSGDVFFGIPQVGVKNMAGDYLENKQLEPTHKVANDAVSSAKGEDKQIAKAVEVLLQKLDAK